MSDGRQAAEDWLMKTDLHSRGTESARRDFARRTVDRILALVESVEPEQKKSNTTTTAEQPQGDERPGPQEVADRIVNAAHEYEGNDPYSGAGNFLFQVRSALAEQPREEREDDARHITWDHGRRTLCGQAVDGDPGDFYLPLGKAPRYDEGGAWCWSCLQLQDEAIGPAEQPRGEEEREAAERAEHEVVVEATSNGAASRSTWWRVVGGKPTASQARDRTRLRLVPEPVDPALNAEEPSDA